MKTLNNWQLHKLRQILFNQPYKVEMSLTEWRGTLFEQYKLYVEMADKISERRNTANSFFLTANTLLITIFGGLVAFRSESEGNRPFPIVQLREDPILGFVAIGAALAGVALCVTWYSLIIRYRNLNQQKFAVIQELEQHLPAKPYLAEENVPVEGNTGLTKAERYIPIVFGFLYGAIIISLLTIYISGLIPIKR
ncbi:MAG: hypothetical protein J0M33_17290 [Anaerolineae bacterium]|nr:hypothetical protein [Anaerolineae bacterium]